MPSIDPQPRSGANLVTNDCECCVSSLFGSATLSLVRSLESPDCKVRDMERPMQEGFLAAATISRRHRGHRRFDVLDTDDESVLGTFWVDGSVEFVGALSSVFGLASFVPVRGDDAVDAAGPRPKPEDDPRIVEVISQAGQQAAEWVADQARDELGDAIGAAFARGVNSPIERLFFAAFLPYQICDPSYRIDPQVEIGSYRADFVVTFAPSEVGALRVVVECDGHDYHERTKEQAERDKKRDRYMSAEGYTVMRFTGRELWRDPFQCVEEVVDFTQRGLG